MSDLTPAEEGLTKKCNVCGRRLPLDAFYVRDRHKLTRDGRRYRMSRCGPCFGQLRRDRGGRSRLRDVARRRALRRLTTLVPELWERVFAEELAKEGLE